MFAAHSISVRLGKRLVLDNVTLQFPRGELVII